MHDPVCKAGGFGHGWAEASLFDACIFAQSTASQELFELRVPSKQIQPMLVCRGDLLVCLRRATGAEMVMIFTNRISAHQHYNFSKAQRSVTEDQRKRLLPQGPMWDQYICFGNTRFQYNQEEARL